MKRIIKLSLGAVLAGCGSWTTGQALAQGVAPVSGPYRSAGGYSGGMPTAQSVPPPQPIAMSPIGGPGKSYPTSQFPGAPGMPGPATEPGAPAGAPVGAP